MSSLHRMLRSLAVIVVLAMSMPVVICAQDAGHPGDQNVAPAHQGESHQATSPGTSDTGHAPTATAGDQHENVHGAGHDDLGIQGDLALWSGVAFVLFALVVWRLDVLNGIANALFSSVSGHEQRELNALKNAELLTSEANEILRKNKGRVEALDETVRATIEEAGRDASHTTSEILKVAQAEAASFAARAQMEIERVRDQSLNEIFDTLASKVTEATERRLREQLDHRDQDRLIDDTLNQLTAARS